ncbi:MULTISPECIES: hypothetical protein [unclassified Pseudomonas]|uniref:hypothetical protein n=1 Tax=unclassified Pseudomonas TaxID=196821 RepID=UPI000D380B3B|nr:MULTISPECIES: hypothetical protein [unclassified Pseudomonas]RAU43418.1 hypothetical protein DBP26_019650 [Pseudomonas sp. RIT 409]RAU50045.1 hypothetical protein DBY65_023135 [Pseudomonas sp. RIT 412]
MPTVRFRNNTGNVLIDDTYQNLALRASGQVTTAPTNIPGLSQFFLTLPSDQGVLAFRCANPCSIFNVTYANGNATYQLCTTGGNAVVSYWQFDLPQYTAAPLNWPKLIVRNPVNGSLIFDSRLKYMRVLDFIEMSIDDGNPNPYQPVYAGRLPAVIESKRAWNMVSQILPGTPTIAVGGYSGSFASTPSTQVNIYKNQEYYTYNDRPANSDGYPAASSYQSAYMIVDVSNF